MISSKENICHRRRFFSFNIMITVLLIQ